MLRIRRALRLRVRHSARGSPASSSPGRKRVFRLQTREGYYVRATADHRIMTGRGWVEITRPLNRQRVHILNRKGGFGGSGTLEEGRVWGWLVGDGTISESNRRAHLNFYGSEKARACFRRLCRPHGRRRRTQEGEYRVGTVRFSDDRMGVTSTRLRTLGGEIGLAANKLRVPPAIRRGSEGLQRGFLQGLFSADGTVSGSKEKGFSVRLTSISLELLEAVQQMLLNFGIASRVYRDRRGGEKVSKMPDGRGGRRGSTRAR